MFIRLPVTLHHLVLSSVFIFTSKTIAALSLKQNMWKSDRNRTVKSHRCRTGSQLALRSSVTEGCGSATDWKIKTVKLRSDKQTREPHTHSTSRASIFIHVFLLQFPACAGESETHTHVQQCVLVLLIEHTTRETARGVQLTHTHDVKSLKHSPKFSEGSCHTLMCFILFTSHRD